MKLKFTFQTQSASSTLQKHKSSSSFTPFIDPRLLQISPSSGTTVTSVGKYSGVKEGSCQTGPSPHVASLMAQAQHGGSWRSAQPARPFALIAWIAMRSWSISFPCPCFLEHLFFEKVSAAVYGCLSGASEGVRQWCLCTENKSSMYCVSVGFSCDGLRPEAIRQDPTRKGSVVNVNPTNTRPQSDTPEIRKYKKRFNSEILCAALWGRYLTAVR